MHLFAETHSLPCHIQSGDTSLRPVVLSVRGTRLKRNNGFVIFNQGLDSKGRTWKLTAVSLIYCNDKGVIYGQVSDTGKWRFLLRHRIGGSAREEGSD